MKENPIYVETQAWQHSNIVLDITLRHCNEKENIKNEHCTF